MTVAWHHFGNTTPRARRIVMVAMIRLPSAARCMAQASLRSTSARLASSPHRAVVGNSQELHSVPSVVVVNRNYRMQARRMSSATGSAGLKGLMAKDHALESQGFRAGAEVRPLVSLCWELLESERIGSNSAKVTWRHPLISAWPCFVVMHCPQFSEYTITC